MSLRETLLPGSPDLGAARRLRLHVPDTPPPPEGWPLLSLLDGDWVWPLAASALKHCAVLMPSHGPLGSVGLNALARRALDYTPPAPDGGHWPDPRMPQWLGGGAMAFLDTLLGDMLAWAQAQTRLDPSRHALYGHSYGGLCVLFALAHRPDAFSHILCASPSLWWHNDAILKVLDRLKRHPPVQPTRLTLMAGSDEHWYPHPTSANTSRTRQNGIPTLPALQALMDRLTQIPQMDCRLELLDQLGHGQVLPVSAERAIVLAAA